MGLFLSGLVGSILLFLSLWIVIPAWNFRLLPLAVGAPEISPLLLLLSLGLLTLQLGSALWHKRSSPYWLIAMLLLTLVLSSQPLLQQSKAVASAEKSMIKAFPDSQILETGPAYSWLTFFSGLVGAQRLSSPNVRHQSKIPFATPEATPLFLDVYQPPEPGRYPAVVMIYGGGWSAGSSAENEAFGRFLATRGYVAIAIDYRHTPDYRFPTQLEDVKTALAFVQSHADTYEIMSDHVSLLGWSAGAQLAMLAGFQSEQPVQSVINFYGPVDLARGYAEPPEPDPLDVRQVLLAFLGGSPKEKPTAYEAASPITFARSAQPDTLPPVLLIYGGKDNIVESRFGRYLHEQLLATGNTAVWVHIPWAQHAFDKVFSGISNQMALHFVEQFLSQTLPTGPAAQ